MPAKPQPAAQPQAQPASEMADHADLSAEAGLSQPGLALPRKLGANPRKPSPQAILQLQRTIGNRAVQSLLNQSRSVPVQRQAYPPQKSSAPSPISQPLQRIAPGAAASGHGGQGLQTPASLFIFPPVIQRLIRPEEAKAGEVVYLRMEDGQYLSGKIIEELPDEGGYRVLYQGKPRIVKYADLEKEHPKEKQKKIASQGGRLDAEAGALAAEPVLTKPVEDKDHLDKDGEPTTKTGVFIEPAHILNAQGEVIGQQVQRGKVCVVLLDWKKDDDLTVKTATHYKVSQEDKDKAGENYVSMARGYVEKTKVTLLPRTEKDDSLRYLPRNDPKVYPLFPRTPTKEDVQQGYLGDCYLMAAIASVVAKTPQHFVNHMKDHGNGRVTVRLYQGVADPLDITINKSIVVKKEKEGDVPAFAKEALWVMLLEKAYVAAGFHGSEGILPVAQKAYGMIAGGHGEVALMHLTGKVTARQPLESKGEEAPLQLRFMPLMNSATVFITTEMTALGLSKDEDKETSQFIRGAMQAGDNPDKLRTDEEYCVLMDKFKVTKPKVRQYLLFQKKMGDINSLSAEMQELASKVVLSKQQVEVLLKKYHFNKNSPIWKIMVEGLSQISEDALTGALGSGKYKKSERKLFQKITAKLDAGEFVVIATKEKIYSELGDVEERGHSGNEPMVKGLAGNHAYTVLDYAPKPPKEGQTYSVKLRNPWGHYGRKYVKYGGFKTVDISRGEPWTGATPAADKNAGEFWIDLAELSTSFDNIYFSDSAPVAPAPAPEPGLVQVKTDDLKPGLQVLVASEGLKVKGEVQNFNGLRGHLKLPDGAGGRDVIDGGMVGLRFESAEGPQYQWVALKDLYLPPKEKPEDKGGEEA